MTTKHKRPINDTDFEKIVEQAMKKVLDMGLKFGLERGKCEAKEAFRKTETRLYAYPELLRNIEKYKKDIEDLRMEDPGRSKDIVFFSIHGGGGNRLSAEEVQEARILLVQRKIYRDQVEIDEMNYALEFVKNDEYYPLLTMRYFEGKSDDEIAEKMACDPSTIRRNKSRLIRVVAVKLYGAEAVG